MDFLILNVALDGIKCFGLRRWGRLQPVVVGQLHPDARTQAARERSFGAVARSRKAGTKTGPSQLGSTRECVRSERPSAGGTRRTEVARPGGWVEPPPVSRAGLRALRRTKVQFRSVFRAPDSRRIATARRRTAAPPGARADVGDVPAQTLTRSPVPAATPPWTTGHPRARSGRGGSWRRGRTVRSESSFGPLGYAGRDQPASIGSPGRQTSFIPGSHLIPRVGLKRARRRSR
jgi:hypothetical protein